MLSMINIPKQRAVMRREMDSKLQRDFTGAKAFSETSIYPASAFH